MHIRQQTLSNIVVTDGVYVSIITGCLTTTLRYKSMHVQQPKVCTSLSMHPTNTERHATEAKTASVDAITWTISKGGGNGLHMNYLYPLYDSYKIKKNPHNK